ncbi:alpha-E domain-containing protein [soil metagenome]
MLSRVADNLYWMARYIERAENLARMIDVNLQLLLDYQTLDDEALREYWRPLIGSAGDEETFHKLYDEEDSTSITRFITSDRRNPNSILECVSAARENARMIRDQISEETWEELNGLYLFLRSPDAEIQREAEPFDFYQRIRNGSLLFQAIVDATTPQDEGWHFRQLGKFLERADKTTRMLDITTFLPGGDSPEYQGLKGMQWVAILRSCSAFAAYRALYGANVVPDRITEFLIFSKEFPRSVRFCALKINESLHQISGAGYGFYSNEAERLSGRELSNLNFGSLDEVYATGLHEFLDRRQQIFNDIGKGIHDTYVLLPDTYFSPSNQMQLHAQQQQQQQQQGRRRRR